MTLETSRWEAVLGVYVLPLAVGAAVVMFVIWRLNRRDITRLAQELEQARRLVQQRESERDLALKEIFRRLYEERELTKDKVQFQSQLAEYEKYAALAQLALGAAHEINNPAASWSACANWKTNISRKSSLPPVTTKRKPPGSSASTPPRSCDG